MDLIHIGETVDVARPGYPTWRGEVTDEGPTPDRVWAKCIGEPADGTTTLVDVAWVTRAGDPEGMREDGCDDVDVTGRARPYHRHAVTGEAHAHPSGDLAHTHQIGPLAATLEAGLTHIGEVAAAAARGFTDAAGLTETAPPDPVEILARHFTWTGDLGSNERSIRAALAELVAGPWHLVTFDKEWQSGVPWTAYDIAEIDQEWTP